MMKTFLISVLALATLSIASCYDNKYDSDTNSTDDEDNETRVLEPSHPEMEMDDPDLDTSTNKIYVDTSMRRQSGDTSNTMKREVPR